MPAKWETNRNKAKATSEKKFEDNPFGLRNDNGPKPKMAKETLRRYGRRIGPKLKELVQRQYEIENHTDMREELAFARQVHEERIGMYNDLLTLEDQTTDQKQLQAIKSTKELAAAVMMSSTQDIVAMCEKIAKIDQMAAMGLAPFAIDSVVRQINQFIYRIFDAEPINENDSLEEVQRKQAAHDRVRMFEHAMDNELELPSIKDKGTSITPDMQVLAMDATIPSEPEAESQGVDDVRSQQIESGLGFVGYQAQHRRIHNIHWFLALLLMQMTFGTAMFWLGHFIGWYAAIAKLLELYPGIIGK